MAPGDSNVEAEVTEVDSQPTPEQTATAPPAQTTTTPPEQTTTPPPEQTTTTPPEQTTTPPPEQTTTPPPEQTTTPPPEQTGTPPQGGSGGSGGSGGEDLSDNKDLSIENVPGKIQLYKDLLTTIFKKTQLTKKRLDTYEQRLHRINSFVQLSVFIFRQLLRLFKHYHQILMKLSLTNHPIILIILRLIQQMK